MAVLFDIATAAPRSWQSRVVSWVVWARMRQRDDLPIDPLWVRNRFGKPRTPRHIMVRATGATYVTKAPVQQWPGGDVVTWPGGAAGGKTAPVLLYLHGGGYIACSPESHRPLVASIVRRVGGTAYVPDYRLAPEHPYPAALDDAVAAYRHLYQDLGVAPRDIVIAGDSAGGGLALALTLWLRDHGEPLPACVVTLCPWTDLAVTGNSIDENTDRCVMFAGETIRKGTGFYLSGADATLPYVSPLYGELRGCPPLLVHASNDEVLRDDGVRVAHRASAAGVEVELRLWHGVPHVWQFFPAVLPEAEQSLADVTRFIARWVAHARATR